MNASAALAAYFKRIGYNGEPRADLDTLQQLHALHPRSIPFENLDSWLGLPVVLEQDAVFNKLVTRGRGGYCFEHNLLFMQTLQALGFQVQGLAARVLWNLPVDSFLPRTHMLLLVAIDGRRYIADVGFGGLTMTAALQLDTVSAQGSPHEEFRIISEAGHYAVHALIAGNWQPLYRFSLEIQLPADYVMANWYVSTHPQSRFLSQLIAARADAAGRHVLLNTRYTRYITNGMSEQAVLDSPAMVRKVLQEVFLINSENLPGLDARLQNLFGE